MPEALDIQKAMRNLCEVRLFCDLSQDQLERVAGICEFMEMEQGQYLIIEGREADCVFILLKGEVHIVRQLELPHIAAVKGSERILTRITAEGNPLVGETALLGSGKRRSSVRCVTNCLLYRIKATDLKHLLSDDAEIGRAVYLQLAELLHQRLDATSLDVVKLSAALVLALEQ